MIPAKTPAGSFRTILFGDGRAGATDVLPLVAVATQRVSWKSKPIYKELGTSGLDDSMGSFSITHFGRIKQCSKCMVQFGGFPDLTVHDFAFWMNFGLCRLPT